MHLPLGVSCFLGRIAANNMPEHISQYRLKNGLSVLLKEIHSAPLVSHWIWYRVGSRNEIPGLTGLSHWVEHMQFKGTPQYPAGELDRAISRDGGVWNAFTFMDWTAYFETMPADKVDLALQLEADRMSNSLFLQEDVEAERSVILSELEGSLNEPLSRLDTAVQMAAFTTHPYRYEVIGEIDDLRQITRDDLYGHYRRFYTPNNAVLAIAGDFNLTKIQEKIEALYGDIPAGEVIYPDIATENPLAAQQVSLSGPGDTTFLRVAYRAPTAREDDFFAFTVVDSLLSGPSGLNWFGGGGISNKTSRLYRALVEQELVISIHAGLQATIDPYLYTITALVRPERTPEEALAAIDKEIRRLQDELVSEEEIRRAVKQARAMFAYGSENITNQAFWLGYAEMFDHYQWFQGYMDRLENVTSADIQRLANQYWQDSCRVVGIYHPDTGQEGSL
jgi:zinc protease